ncbi:O-antigen ligase family protein [Aneurinibacillus terranovensis]|uniref:O-antigen ligase family protein n=1 Tax=Aneurinibacillus terranovensis TaxID=278991 RepID=UPI000421CCD9|nr:O-antigen ligase family protein [Aneurinibacillus terranovensis]
MNVALGLIIVSPYLAFLPMIYLLYYFFKRGELTLRNEWTKGLLFLFLWSFLVGLMNNQGFYVLTSLVILGYLFVSIYIHSAYRKTEDVERLFLSLFWLSLGSAFLGLLEHWNIITYSPAWWKYFLGTRSIVDITESQRISGTFNNPNLAGTWYAAMIMIGFYFFRRVSGMRKFAYVGAVALYIFVLMMTESRAAVIGLFLGFVIYAYFAGHKKKMLMLMFILLSGTALMLNRPEWFPRGDILFSSIQDRQEIWKNCFNMFMMKPITGWGIMGIYFADSSVYHYMRVFHAHNTLLTIATTLGMVGLLAFIWMEWSLLQGIRVLYQNQCRITPLLSGIKAMILGHGLFDFTIMSPQIGLLFVGCSALIGALAYRYSPELVRTRFPLPVRYRRYKKI